MMREVIRTPAFLEIIKSNMSSADPERARLAVRTVLWEDPELTLSLAGVAPEVVNYLIEAVLELGRQLNGFPAPLLSAFLDELGRGVNSAGLREIPDVYGPLIEKTELAKKAAPAFGAAVNAGSRAVNRAAGRNPYFVGDLMGAIDGRQLARAAFAVARSILLWGYTAAVRLVVKMTGG